MVTVLYHVTQLRLLGYRRARYPLEIKASAQTSFPAGFATGLSLVHLNVLEEENPVGRGRQNRVSSHVPALPGSGGEQGRQPSAVPRVMSQQMLPCITTREERRRHVRGQHSPCQEEEAAGEGGRASLGNVKMAQSGDPAGGSTSLDGGPIQPRKPAFVSPQQPLSGFRDSAALPRVRSEGVTWPSSETYRWGDRHEKDKAAKRGGWRAGTAASCPGPGPALCPLRSQNSIFHLFSCNSDVFFAFLFLREPGEKGWAKGHNLFQGNFRSAGKGEKRFPLHRRKGRLLLSGRS